MKFKKKTCITKPALLLLPMMVIGSCGKKSDSSSAASTESAGSLRISLIAAGDSSATGSLRLNPVSFDVFENKTIASASPDEMTIAIKEMRLSNKAADKTTLIFQDEIGKNIRIAGSSVDLSDFFTKIECVKSDGTVFDVPEGKSCKCGLDADGELIDLVDSTDADGNAVKSCPERQDGDLPPFGVMEVSQLGDYDTLTVTYVNKGEASGCVSGNFRPSTSSPSAVAATYCTKAGLDLDSASNATKADFPSSGPTTQSIYWSRGGKDAGANLTKEYPIGETISITEGGDSPQITLVIDRGRMLRFYDGEGSTGPNPGAPDVAHFFSTVFEDSTYVFVGRAGNIRGYRYAFNVISDQPVNATFPAAGSRECVAGGNTICQTVNGWMTLIEDVDQNPFAVSFMPDDDNALTVLKGNNSLPSSPGKIDPTKITVNTDKSWSLQYSMFSPKTPTEGLSGTIYSLDPGAAVGASQTVEITAEQTDSSVGQFRTWGTVTFLRAQ